MIVAVIVGILGIFVILALLARMTKPKLGEARRYGKVTWNGRVVVDANQLYRALRKEKR